MKTIVLNFEREWIRGCREKYGNPIRQIERFIKSETIKLVRSDFASITVSMEDDKCKEKIDVIIGFMKQKFEVENPWKKVNISGDIAEIEDFIRERSESGLAAEVRLDDTEEKEAAKEIITEDKKPKNNIDVEKKEKEVSTKEEKQVSQEKQELEGERTLGTRIQYSPVMENYLKELNQIIPMLGQMKAEECIWSQNLLVSIDSGFGYSEFLKELANLFGAYDFADKNEKNNWVKEIVVPQENKYEEWKEVINTARAFSRANDRKSKRVILSIDISEWQTELHSEKVLKYLRELNEYSKNFICVFRVPYMEFPVLQKIGESLSDVMSIKALSIPAVTIDSMVDYIKKNLNNFKCTLEEGCDSYLEQWILKEKSDDSFFGFKTLDKIVKEIIYQKAILNCENGCIEKHITEADMKSMLKGEAADENPYDVLNRLIGIAQIKKQIDEIVIQIKAYKKLSETGTELERPSIHMMFTGNPGTGKTTVARILARILKEEGVLRKGLFYEIQGRSLCGRYIGETAPRTSAFCRDAYGSVLFIDEAYGLAVKDSDRDYGKEAIQTLIVEMENHRDDFCVILAGYKKLMHELLEVNPGLKSRIPYEIEFPNYTNEELTQIFFRMLEGKFEYEEALKEEVEAFFASIPEEVLNSEEFSNARLVRNLFERVWGKAAYRCAMDGDSKIVLHKEDFKYACEMADFKGIMTENRKNKIGFSFS